VGYYTGILETAQHRSTKQLDFTGAVLPVPRMGSLASNSHRNIGAD